MATSANTAAQSVLTGNKAGVIGTVKRVVGEVTATDQSGVQRVLQEGDQVSANDVIQTSADGAVDIAFINNTHVDLGRNSQITLDNSVFDPRQAATDQNDIAAIQAAIAAGADPTTLVPATAAGAGAADEGGSSFVVVDQNAAPGNVTSGFETAGGFVAPPVPLANGGVTPVVAAAAIPTETPPETPPATPPETPPEAPPVASTPPVAANDLIVTSEDTAVSGSVATNDTPGSAGGNVWTINAVATHGEVVLSPDGTYTYTPVANYNGPDSFSYNLTDANDNVSSATVVVNVTPVNDAPVAVNDNVVAGQNQPLNGTSVLANDTDVDGDPLNATLVAGAQHGAVVVKADGTFVYTPIADYHGPDSFTYQANDGTSDSNIATVTIDVNASPVGEKEQYFVMQSGTLSVPAANGVLSNDTDVDSTTLTAVLLRDVENGSLTLNPDGSFNYVPTDGYNGSDSYTYQPSDGITRGMEVLVSLFIEPLTPLPAGIPPVVLSSSDASTSFTGTTGADIIHGSTANDIISGGPSDDILSGSLGINTFVYHHGDLSAGAGGDHILDFKVGTATVAGDVLDISDLLSGHGISESDFAVNAASYLQVISNAGVTTIQFDANGTGGASPLPLATLDGVGPGLTLNTLLDHGQIHAA